MNVRKWTALLLALTVFLCLAPASHAATEYPPRPAGTVADLASVLGEKTIEDLETLNGKTEEAASYRLFVLTRHFLGGADAQQYADQVFSVWNLEKGDALLLLVIGEEEFALALGADTKTALPQEARNTLLGSFRNAYKARKYDEALADLASQLSQAVAKATTVTLNLTGYFSQEAIQSTPQPQAADDWWYGMFARDDYDSREDWDEKYWQSWQDEWRYEESSINWRSVIIWALVIYFLFFRKKKRNRGRR